MGLGIGLAAEHVGDGGEVLGSARTEQSADVDRAARIGGVPGDLGEGRTEGVGADRPKQVVCLCLLEPRFDQRTLVALNDA